MIRPLLVATAALLFAGVAHAKPLSLDGVHSKVGFTASTTLFDVDGTFGKYTVEITEGTADAPESAKVKASISVASIDTDNTKRDNHLRSPDFFDAPNYPNIIFESTSVKKTATGLDVTGTLTMRGKSHAVTIPFRVADGKNGAGTPTRAYRGKLTIDRTKFGVGTDSIAAKISLANEVEVDLLIVTFPGK